MAEKKPPTLFIGKLLKPAEMILKRLIKIGQKHTKETEKQRVARRSDKPPEN